MTPTEWLLSGDTGTSSKTILAVMTGSATERADIPYDNDARSFRSRTLSAKVMAESAKAIYFLLRRT